MPLGPARGPVVTGSIGPVEVKPAATLACPLVSTLDKWIATAVQPAALHWFRQPVVEIKQISAYSCRGMNGNAYARISEHAFGNALDIAEFELADGRKVSVQYGWHGAPEEQGFLRDVQAAACEEFSTVLAPGANIYHYNHIHVDLMRRRERPPASASRPRSPARSSPSARGRATPRSTTATPASPARSAGSRSGAPSAIPARTMIACRSPCPATTEVFCAEQKRAPPESRYGRSICASSAAVGQQSTFSPLRF